MNNNFDVTLHLTKVAVYIARDNFKDLDHFLKHLKHLKFNPERIYETILQSYLFCGFPAALESLKVFKKHFKNFNKPKTNYSLNIFKNIGTTNCKLIYRNYYKKLIENINGWL